MNITAIYPGTFDPITLGHSDIIDRATGLFDKVIVAIARSPSKQPAFSIQARINMARQVLGDKPQIEICGFDSLLVEFAVEKRAKVILRGLRAVSDFEYEFQLAGMNKKLRPELETIFMSPEEQYTYISSSLVKEIASHGGNITAFVHPDVEQQLSQHFKQNINT